MRTSACWPCAPEAWTAGNAPKTRPHRIEAASAKRTARPSSATSSSRGVPSGATASSSRSRPYSDEQAERPAGDRHEAALDQELADETTAPAAERRTDAQLVLPGRAARDEQVRDVDAGDQEETADRAEQDEQRESHGGDQLRGERRRADADVRVRLRILALEPRADGLHLGPGRCQRHARPQPSHAEEARMVAAIEQVRVVRDPQADRHEDVVVAAEIPKARRQHADDRVARSIEGDRTAQGGRVAAEAILPERVADDRFGWRVRAVFGFAEQAAHARAHADDVEETAGDTPAAEPFRVVDAGERHRLGARQREGVERVLTRAPVDEIRPRHRHLRAVGPDLVQVDEAIRLWIRQRPQQDAVDEREDGRGRADAERQRDEDDGGERRRPGERAHGVANVLPERVEPHRWLLLSNRMMSIGAAQPPPAVPRGERQRLPPAPPARPVASAGFEVLDEIAEDRVATHAPRQRPLEQPAREARQTAHELGSFSTSSSPRQRRRSVSREARSAATPGGVTE